MAETLSIVIGHRTARVGRADEGLSVDNDAVEVVYGPVRGEVVLRHEDRQTRAFVARTPEGTWVFH